MHAFYTSWLILVFFDAEREKAEKMVVFLSKDTDVTLCCCNMWGTPVITHEDRWWNCYNFFMRLRVTATISLSFSLRLSLPRLGLHPLPGQRTLISPEMTIINGSERKTLSNFTALKLKLMRATMHCPINALMFQSCAPQVIGILSKLASFFGSHGIKTKSSFDSMLNMLLW